VQNAARRLGQDLRVPGFRKGKVPPPVVIQRLGRGTVLNEAVQQALGGWYEQAVTEARVATVGEPQLDLNDLPEKGSPLEFSVEIGVRPTATLGTYKGLEVGRREPEVSQEKIDQEVDRLRESLASLESVDRPASQGDFVVLDFVGKIDGVPFEGGEARGYSLELGSGTLVEGFEDQLVGAEAGSEVEVSVSFPDEHQAEQLAGKTAVFDTTVKEVKEKRLPEVDDDFAAEAGGFETLGELRSDIESSLRETEERSIEDEFRQAVVEAAVSAAQVDTPDQLVWDRARQMWNQTAQQLRRQGVSPETYLQMSGKTEEQLTEDAKPDAEQALRRESVLAAIVDADSIEVSEQEMMEALRQAQQGNQDAQATDKQLRKALERVRSQGREDALREDIAMRKAVDLLVENAEAISMEQASAREKIWTPDKEEGQAQPKELWTPGN
jgi:trigger factor